jgi:hypothetical protein
VLSADEFDKERAKMVTVCANRHSENFAKEELAKGDQLIEKIDHLMAEAIREIVGLYKEGLPMKPDSYAYAYPDLLTFHDSPTTIENRLFTMHLKHRMRAFQGAFHMNPASGRVSL